jgi:thymidylate synthase (FAD)
VDHTEHAERKISTYAAICYAAQLDEAACDRRIKKLLNLGHLATLRFGYATFLVSGISRACSHQLVRAKHLDFLQESQRYVKQTDTKFVFPELRNVEMYRQAYEVALHCYNELIRNGVRKEDARYVLPNAATTELYVTGNFQAWKDFLRNRQDKAAQWEIREVANQIATRLYEIAPTVFQENYEKALESAEV